MGGLNILGTFQVSYRSTHLKDPVVRSGAQAELGDGRFHEPLPFPAHLTEPLEFLGPHLGVGMDLTLLKPLGLHASSRIDPFTNSV